MKGNVPVGKILLAFLTLAGLGGILEFLLHAAPLAKSLDKHQGAATGVVGVLAVVATIAALWISHRVHVWNQNRATIDVASRWSDGELAEVRSRLREALPDEEPPDVLLSLLHGDRALRSDLVTLLNHLDMVAVGIRMGLFQRGPICHLYLGIIATYYLEFLPFIDDTRARTSVQVGTPSRQENLTWEYLIDVARDWLQQEYGWSEETLRQREDGRKLPAVASGPGGPAAA
ncbi:MAG: hypothetical protein QOI63_21 [Thermoplasmata archaeon]|jgi:hypothetical protein|nr:hypothetical protein [Thermoplasmata archaeon]